MQLYKRGQSFDISNSDYFVRFPIMPLWQLVWWACYQEKETEIR